MKQGSVFAVLCAAMFLLPALAGCSVRMHCPVANGDTVAFLGDSITYNGTIHRDGYCQLVLAGLKTMGVEATPVFAGVSGNTSADMLNRIDHDVIARHPQWMILNCGVNDIWHSLQEGRTGVPLPEFRANVESMVKKAQASGIQVVLMTATVLGEPSDQPLHRRFGKYNQAMIEVARQYHCLLADTGKAVRDEIVRLENDGKTSGRLLTIDGVHMKREGDEVIAETLLRTLGADDAMMAEIKAAWQTIPPDEH